MVFNVELRELNDDALHAVRDNCIVQCYQEKRANLTNKRESVTRTLYEMSVEIRVSPGTIRQVLNKAGISTATEGTTWGRPPKNV